MTFGARRTASPGQLAVTEAVALNPDVRANAVRDVDLAVVRDSGRLATLLGS